MMLNIDDTIDTGVIKRHRKLSTSSGDYEFLLEWNTANVSWVPQDILRGAKHPCLTSYACRLLETDEFDEYTKDIQDFMGFNFSIQHDSKSHCGINIESTDGEYFKDIHLLYFRHVS